MAKIQTIKNKDNITIYPQTHTQAVYDADGEKLQNWMDKYVTAENAVEIENILLSAELKTNKVTVIDADASDTQYPSAKAVYDFGMSLADIGIKFKIVGALPTQGDNATIYLVLSDKPEDKSIYDEYIYIQNNWELIGSTKIDLSNYATKDEIPTKISELENDNKYLTEEMDPTVPAWAKAATKPAYNKNEIGLENVDNVRQYSINNPPPYPVIEEDVDAVKTFIAIYNTTSFNEIQAAIAEGKTVLLNYNDTYRLQLTYISTEQFNFTGFILPGSVLYSAKCTSNSQWSLEARDFSELDEIKNASATAVPIYNIWVGSQAQYDTITEKDPNTEYNIIEE